jgi:hypothetical protein
VGGACDQLDSDVALEPAQLLAQRRLRDVDLGGRATEVQLVGDGQE